MATSATVNILIAICIIAAVTVFIFSNGSTIILQQQQYQNTATELSDHTFARQASSTTIQPLYNTDTNSNNNKMMNNNYKRNMVGGYSSVDTELLLSTEIMDVANFCLKEYASKFAASDNNIADASAFVVLPQDVESGDVVVKVLEAQRQVVAGLNYKLTISIHNKNNNNMCLGGIKDIKIYKALPYMNQPLKVTSFGTILDGSDVWLVSLIVSE